MGKFSPVGAGGSFSGSSEAGDMSVVGSTCEKRVEESLAGESSIGTPSIFPVEEPPTEPPLAKGKSDSAKQT